MSRRPKPPPVVMVTTNRTLWWWSVLVGALGYVCGYGTAWWTWH